MVPELVDRIAPEHLELAVEIQNIGGELNMQEPYSLVDILLRQSVTTWRGPIMCYLQRVLLDSHRG